eukprot:TRINITY_DN94525_c0_g1_i1.p1 TRINITY_DN94525_c0_g1~~TRINITY_DN94525_c0_g1_i1.p1  ORF type:complete len:177 (+),score=58.62 TRINITY_DN94525_c0_g1_i1:95-625(+)
MIPWDNDVDLCIMEADVPFVVDGLRAKGYTVDTFEDSVLSFRVTGAQLACGIVDKERTDDEQGLAKVQLCRDRVGSGFSSFATAKVWIDVYAHHEPPPSGVDGMIRNTATVRNVAIRDVRKSLVLPTKLAPFCNSLFRVPRDTDAYLRQQYGPKYANETVFHNIGYKRFTCSWWAV